jgi:hypothetical protein
MQERLPTYVAPGIVATTTTDRGTLVQETMQETTIAAIADKTNSARMLFKRA